MARELTRQSDLIKAAEELGGWGIKADKKYLGGVPDLELILPKDLFHPTLPRIGGWSFRVEVKTMDAWPVRMTDQVKFSHPLTELQHQTLMDIQRSGGLAGWVTIYTKGREQWVLSGLNKHDIPTKEQALQCRIERPYGTKWSWVLPKILTPLIAPHLDRMVSGHSIQAASTRKT